MNNQRYMLAAGLIVLALIGSTVEANVGLNVPLAAALTSVPVAIMAVYLLVAKRLGAFEAL